MNIQIDFRSRQPAYLQIVEQIRIRIAQEQLRPGDQLPTVRQLASSLGVNFNTVARAYRILDADGLLSTQHGRGTFVWNIPPDPESGPRQKELRYLVKQFLDETTAQGYSAGEIQAACEGYFRSGGKTEEPAGLPVFPG